MDMQEEENKGNKGEQAEIKIKKDLFIIRLHCEFLVKIFGEQASEGIELIDTNTNAPYTDVSQIKKAAAGSKADMVILFKKTNQVRYCSMKSLSGAKPSVLNHTPRSAKVFQTELHPYLKCFDKLAAEYIEKRTNKIITEDVKFCDLESSKDAEITESFIKLLSYFVFTGTGAKRSPNECDCILVINKDETVHFIDCSTTEKKELYIKSIIDTSVISFRNKGMPSKINDECLPWVYKNETSGKQCGSIHIRL